VKLTTQLRLVQRSMRLKIKTNKRGFGRRMYRPNRRCYPVICLKRQKIWDSSGQTSFEPGSYGALPLQDNSSRGPLGCEAV
jgi:hypothetical protein